MQNRVLGTIKWILIVVTIVIAAAGGVYSAKIYTTPYSMEVLRDFEYGTLDSVEISKERCNILALGADKSGMLTDVMMLAQIDPAAKKVTIMSIPRDTRVSFNGKTMKINAVHSIGRKNSGDHSENSIKIVKTLTGVPINHFVKINFEAFRDSIDELGGVDFDVPQRMKYSDPYQDLYIDLQKGMQHLDGDKAEQLVRFRRYRNGDLDRIKVQQEFIHELATQKLQVKNIGKVDDIYRIVSKNMETSMTPGDAVQCAKQVLSIGIENIETITLPATPQYFGEVSYVVPDTNKIAEVREEYFGYDSHGNELPKTTSSTENSSQSGANSHD